METEIGRACVQLSSPDFEFHERRDHHAEGGMGLRQDVETIYKPKTKTLFTMFQIKKETFFTRKVSFFVKLQKSVSNLKPFEFFLSHSVCLSRKHIEEYCFVAFYKIG